jgi:hypothetical protein
LHANSFNHLFYINMMPPSGWQKLIAIKSHK